MKNYIVFALIVLAGFVTFTPPASAHHSWDGFHWARTANPFVLKIGDNVSATWDSYLATGTKNWSLSSVLDTKVVKGRSNVRTCTPTLGQVEICNSKYGTNGWLGLTSIWSAGDYHISQAVTKLNDTYFSQKQFNTASWKNLVVCHELGHTLGLAHRDEIFENANIGSCLDYTNIPEGNTTPDAHDYEMLEEIYAHLDSISTLALGTTTSAKAEIGNDESDWGKPIKKDEKGRNAVFERDLGDGNKVTTHVFWVTE